MVGVRGRVSRLEIGTTLAELDLTSIDPVFMMIEIEKKQKWWCRCQSSNATTNF
jgi:hypothetical protein